MKTGDRIRSRSRGRFAFGLPCGSPSRWPDAAIASSSCPWANVTHAVTELPLDEREYNRELGHGEVRRVAVREGRTARSHLGATTGTTCCATGLIS